MENKIDYTFFGNCYGCGKYKEIFNCIRWATQIGSDGKKVFGSYRNFCLKCTIDFGTGINRKKRFARTQEAVTE